MFQVIQPMPSPRGTNNARLFIRAQSGMALDAAPADVVENPPASKATALKLAKSMIAGLAEKLGPETRGLESLLPVKSASEDDELDLDDAKSALKKLIEMCADDPDAIAQLREAITAAANKMDRPAEAEDDGLRFDPSSSGENRLRPTTPEDERPRSLATDAAVSFDQRFPDAARIRNLDGFSTRHRARPKAAAGSRDSFNQMFPDAARIGVA